MNCSAHWSCPCHTLFYTYLLSVHVMFYLFPNKFPQGLLNHFCPTSIRLKTNALVLIIKNQIIINFGPITFISGSIIFLLSTHIQNLLISMNGALHQSCWCSQISCFLWKMFFLLLIHRESMWHPTDFFLPSRWWGISFTCYPLLLPVTTMSAPPPNIYLSQEETQGWCNKACCAAGVEPTPHLSF